MFLRSVLSIPATGAVRSRLIIATILTIGGILTSCGTQTGDGGIPTPTSAPTPTPDRILSLQIGSSTTLADLRSLTTEPEWSCLQSLAPESSLSSTTLGMTNPLDLMPALGECLGPSSLPDVLIASLQAASGGLSAESIRCLRGTLTRTNALSMGGFANQSDPGLEGLLGLTLCLSEAESQRIDLAGGTDRQVAVSLGQFRCAIEQVDLVQILSGSSQATTESFLDKQFVEAFANCGVDIVAVIGNFSV